MTAGRKRKKWLKYYDGHVRCDKNTRPLPFPLYALAGRVLLVGPLHDLLILADRLRSQSSDIRQKLMPERNLPSSADTPFFRLQSFLL